ncbi:SRPBCC domain-containing protein [Mucilaginibacter sp.]|uniref:SRPBCC domain-containing protein n=1 Tax=Mucilaginibacter sp. TaxID=1882438 RepID=UPI003264CE57
MKLKDNAQTATVEINSPIEKVWEIWHNPADIIHWNTFSPDWHTSHAENDPQPGGRFLFVMGLKDGSFSFNFEGIYKDVIPNQLLTYTLDDGRSSVIKFIAGNPVTITESFEPQDNDPVEDQQGARQAVLNNLKAYIEGK